MKRYRVLSARGVVMWEGDADSAHEAALHVEGYPICHVQVFDNGIWVWTESA